MRKVNREAMALRNVLPKLDPSFYHGWCVDCYTVQPVAARACAGPTAPDLTQFRCETCAAKRTAATAATGAATDATSTGVNCPGCSIVVVKNGGCNHIECHCGTHFCYECGDAFDRDEIYDHMSEEHGGYGFNY